MMSSQYSFEVLAFTFILFINQNMSQERTYKTFVKRKYDSYSNSIDKKKTPEFDSMKSQYLMRNQTPKHMASINKWTKPDFHKISSLETQESRFGSKKITQDSSSGGRYPQKSSIKKCPVKFNHDVKFERQRQAELQLVQQQYMTIRRPKPFTTKNQQLYQIKQQFRPLKSEGTFESARAQSLKCLENLQSKIHSEIFNIDYKLNSFNVKINRIIQNEFKKLKDKIYDIVERVFRDSQKHIAKFMKVQQQVLAFDILQMKQVLHGESLKIQSMKQELHKPNWRKMAGELIANDTLQKIEQNIKQAHQIQVGYWQMPTLFDKKLLSLESQLRQLIKITN